MRRPTRTALAALACLCLLRPAAAAGQTAVEAAPDVVHAALPVPGGVPAFARAIGLNDTIPRARVMLAAIRVLHERPAGADPAADGRRVTTLAYVLQSARQIAGPSDTVPLPLPAAVWTALPDVKAEWRASVLATILGDRRAALAYYGLCAMDIETRAYLAGHADARAVIFGVRAAPVVALYGRSLRIRQGRVDMPGGAAAQTVWEALVGAPSGDPAAFLTQLLTRDGGRLALFFDTLAQLDGSRLAFAFGGPGGDASARAARLKALYDASAPALAGWDPVARPFIRVAYDAAQLLSSVHVTADGELAGPAVRGLWTAAFDGKGLPGLAGEEVKGIRADDRVDAAGLVGLLGGANTTMRRERTECWLFAQRAFAGATPADWLNVLVTLRGYQAFPALVTTLERIGITRPATYAAAIRRANRVTRGFDRRTSTTAVALFQGALSLIERARFSRAIDAEKANALVGSLSAVVGSFEGEYLGGIAEWIELDFLVAVGGLRPSDTAREAVPLEDRVLAAIAGATASRLASAGPGPVVDWEGLRYRVDPEAADFARLVAIRGRQGSTPLDAALAFARVATSVRSAESAAEIGACRRVFDEAAASVANVPGTPAPTAADLDGGQLLERARAGLKDLRERPNPNDLVRLAKLLRQASDAYLAQALVSIAYAPHLGESETTALLGGDPAWRHSFGLEDGRAGQATLNPWRLAVETRGRAEGWYLAGSILNLDLVLQRLSLRRVASDRLPDPPALRETDRQAFTEVVVLMNPADQSDGARDEIVSALARGRQRMAALVGPPDARRTLIADAGLDQWRAEAVEWAADHEPAAAPAFFSLAEVVRLGMAAPALPAGWHAFGVSGWSLEALPALRYLPSLPWAGLTGRNGTRLVPAMVPDLTLGLAEALALRRLPAVLLRGVLAAATQDLLDQLRGNHDDDWMTMMAQAQAVARERFDDYVAALTSGGPLRPER